MNYRIYAAYDFRYKLNNICRMGQKRTSSFFSYGVNNNNGMRKTVILISFIHHKW